MAIVKKDNVTKEIKNESLLADYLLAGWEVASEAKSNKKEEKKVEIAKRVKEVEEDKDIVK